MKPDNENEQKYEKHKGRGRREQKVKTEKYRKVKIEECEYCLNKCDEYYRHRESKKGKKIKYVNCKRINN